MKAMFGDCKTAWQHVLAWAAVRLLFQWDSQDTCGHHGGVVARQVAGHHHQLSRLAAGRTERLGRQRANQARHRRT